MKIIITSMAVRTEFGFVKDQEYETVEAPAGDTTGSVWIVPAQRSIYGTEKPPVRLNSHEYQITEP